MTMINESGAVIDMNEIAAALDTTVADLKAEEDQILTASLEDLLEDLAGSDDPLPEDDVLVENLNPAMESVLNVARHIQESGSISRSDAATLQGMTASLEEFKDAFNNLPLNSYTEMPSKVNYEASMESVLGNIARKIIDAIKAMIKWIREKASNFIQFLRGNRGKAVKTDKAADEVGNALKKSEEIIKNQTGETKKTRERGTKVDLHIPQLVARTTVNHHSLTAVVVGLEGAATGLVRAVDGGIGILYGSVQSLDINLFDKKTEFAKNGDSESAENGMAYLDAVVKRLSEESQDVEVITTDQPEAHLVYCLEIYKKAKMVKVSDKLTTIMADMLKRTQASLKEAEAKIAEYTKQNIRLTNEDPLYKKVSDLKAVIKAAEDIQKVYSSVMSAWSKLIVVGGKVATDPMHGAKAA